MKVKAIFPLLILILCIISSYVSAKRFFSRFPHTQRKRFVPRFGTLPKKRQFTPPKKKLPLRRGFASFARRRAIKPKQQSKSRGSALASVENGILLFIETEIVPIAQQLSTAMGSKEMQEATREEAQKQQQSSRNTFRPGANKFNSFGNRFGGSSGNRNFSSPFKSSGQTSFGSPFGRSPFNRSPFASPFGKPGSNTSPFGSKFGQQSSPFGSSSSKPTRSTPAPTFKGSTTTSKPSTSSSSGGGSFYNTKEKDQQKEKYSRQLNATKRIRSKIIGKMQEINHEIATAINTAQQEEAIRKIATTIVPGLREDLTDLKRTANELSDQPERSKSRQEHTNKTVYQTFLPHLLEAFPHLAQNQEGLSAFRMLFDEIGETVGKQTIRRKSEQFFSNYMRKQRKHLRAINNDLAKLKAAKAEIEAVHTKFPDVPTDTLVNIKQLQEAAQKDIDRLEAAAAATT